MAPGKIQVVLPQSWLLFLTVEHPAVGQDPWGADTGCGKGSQGWGAPKAFPLGTPNPIGLSGGRVAPHLPKAPHER